MMAVRCPACGNENPPEYPPEEYPFCIECGAQLGTYRAGPMPADNYQQDPYGRGQPDPYGRPAPADPYGGARPAPYQQPPPPDPYAGARQDPYVQRQPEPAYAPVQSSGTARLILESGLGKVEYPLDAAVVTIGRSRSNDISLEDARVSRHHARIVRDDRGGFLIEDLNSRNGTRVDERAVRDNAPLAEGAIVRIGDSVFRFTVGPTASMAPAPSSPGPSPFGGPAQGQYGGPAAGPGQYGGPPAAPAGPRGSAGPAGDAAAPEVFLAPWSPVQCPTCQGIKTMRPIVYGPAAQTPGARTAAQRGEVTLGDGPPRPGAPNAECRACGTRVRIVTTGG
jgi:hypothetical protein